MTWEVMLSEQLALADEASSAACWKAAQRCVCQAKEARW